MSARPSLTRPESRWSPFLRGVGSVLDIWPAPHVLDDLVPHETVEDRLAGYWAAVNGHLGSAMGRYESEHDLRPDESTTSEVQGTETGPGSTRSPDA